MPGRGRGGCGRQPTTNWPGPLPHRPASRANRTCATAPWSRSCCPPAPASAKPSISTGPMAPRPGRRTRRRQHRTRHRHHRARPHRSRPLPRRLCRREARRCSSAAPPAGPAGRLSVRGAEAICQRLRQHRRSPNCTRTGSGTPPAPSSKTNSATPAHRRIPRPSRPRLRHRLRRNQPPPPRRSSRSTSPPRTLIRPGSVEAPTLSRVVPKTRSKVTAEARLAGRAPEPGSG